MQKQLKQKHVKKRRVGRKNCGYKDCLPQPMRHTVPLPPPMNGCSRPQSLARTLAHSHMLELSCDTRSKSEYLEETLVKEKASLFNSMLTHTENTQNTPVSFQHSFRLMFKVFKRTSDALW